MHGETNIKILVKSDLKKVCIYLLVAYLTTLSFVKTNLFDVGLVVSWKGYGKKLPRRNFK
jgi:hypothetical protein